MKGLLFEMLGPQSNKGLGSGFPLPSAHQPHQRRLPEEQEPGQPTCLSLSPSPLIFSIPFLAEGVGAFLCVSFGTSASFHPEEVLNIYAKRMGRRGDWAHTARWGRQRRTVCLRAQTVALNLILGLSALVLHREIVVYLSLGKGEVGKCPESRST